MKQIRLSVFETNSSSSHSLALITAETYKQLQKEELFIQADGLSFVSRKEIEDGWKDYVKQYEDNPEDQYYKNFAEYRKRYWDCWSLDELGTEEYDLHCGYEVLIQESEDHTHWALSSAMSED